MMFDIADRAQNTERKGVNEIMSEDIRLELLKDAVSRSGIDLRIKDVLA